MIEPKDQKRIDEQWLNSTIESRHQWIKETEELREFKKRFKPIYAWGFLILIGLQMVVITGIVVAMGIGCLKLEQWVFGIFSTGVFAEACIITRIIVKYLFTSDKEVIHLLDQPGKPTLKNQE